jgi:hypothetical protein
VSNLQPVFHRSPQPVFQTFFTVNKFMKYFHHLVTVARKLALAIGAA